MQTFFLQNNTKMATTHQTVQCAKLIAGDLKERSRLITLPPPPTMDDYSYIDMTRDCDAFKSSRRYMQHATKQEQEFPIAFSLIVYRDVERIERLLRAIYRPHNYYCIHVDSRSSPLLQSALRRIAACFDNVIMASTLLHTRWGSFSLVQAELVCMRDLWRYRDWR